MSAKAHPLRHADDLRPEQACPLLLLRNTIDTDQIAALCMSTLWEQRNSSEDEEGSKGLRGRAFMGAKWTATNASTTTTLRRSSRQITSKAVWAHSCKRNANHNAQRVKLRSGSREAAAPGAKKPYAGRH